MRNLYEKYDISKYEIPETKYEALRISSKLVLQFFLGGEKNLGVRSVTSVFCSSGFVKAVEFVFPVDTEIQWKFGIEHHGLALE